VVIDQLWGAGYHRLLIPDQPLDDDFAAALVRNVMAGIRMDSGRAAEGWTLATGT
jgi:hypothetical protein